MTIRAALSALVARRSWGALSGRGASTLRSGDGEPGLALEHVLASGLQPDDDVGAVMPETDGARRAVGVADDGRRQPSSRPLEVDAERTAGTEPRDPPVGPGGGQRWQQMD